MSTSTLALAHNWGFAIFIIGIIAFCFVILLISYFLGGRAKARTKHVPYESGINSVGSAHLRLSAKFYMVAMFFVIFDVESIFLFAWAISVREVGFLGLIEAAIFILVLLSGLFYLNRIGALSWTPIGSHSVVKGPSEIIKIRNRYS
ncbi:NAD(P)H-quinone oxidoreductase subunit 3, chloroplastic [Candidatus Hartigia pinicola]|nr:NAD(P)H-quinone oxidoreductase subunit 3, chloroplastic [Candidatus Hartigia pinicola]